MGKVEVVAIEGLDLWFNSSDHLPPHFHARKPGEWEVRVFFLACTEEHLEYLGRWSIRSQRLRRRDRDALLAAALEHRVALLSEWEAKVWAAE